jgi:AcrR family transcriptional regulator
MLHPMQEVDAAHGLTDPVDTRPVDDSAPSIAELVGALGLRERKKRARRDALIDATHRLVDRDGLDAVTVEAICEAAGVSVRTFFNYFETKDDAVLGHATYPIDPVVEDEFASGGPTGHLVTDLEHLVGSLLDAAPPGRARLAKGLAIAAQEPRLLARHLAWLDKHKGNLMALVARRLGDDPAHAPDTVASLALFLTHATFVRWESGGSEGEIRDHLHTVVGELRALLAD